jgi:hypothetical protein
LQATTSANWRIVTIQKYASQLTNSIQVTPFFCVLSEALGGGTEAQEVFREHDEKSCCSMDIDEVG